MDAQFGGAEELTQFLLLIRRAAEIVEPLVIPLQPRSAKLQIVLLQIRHFYLRYLMVNTGKFLMLRADFTLKALMAGTLKRPRERLYGSFVERMEDTIRK